MSVTGRSALRIVPMDASLRALCRCARNVRWVAPLLMLACVQPVARSKAGASEAGSNAPSDPGRKNSIAPGEPPVDGDAGQPTPPFEEGHAQVMGGAGPLAGAAARSGSGSGAGGMGGTGAGGRDAAGPAGAGGSASGPPRRTEDVVGIWAGTLLDRVGMKELAACITVTQTVTRGPAGTGAYSNGQAGCMHGLEYDSFTDGAHRFRQPGLSVQCPDGWLELQRNPDRAVQVDWYLGDTQFLEVVGTLTKVDQCP